MSRIRDTFERLRETGRKGFIPFVSAGDPDLETSRRIILELAENGADVIELGIPFTDPMADGPTIQASSQRGLAAGATLPAIFKLVKEIRKRSDVPIVLFSYLNPLYRNGFENTAAAAAEAGVDGILVTDAVDDSAFIISRVLAGYGLDLISLIAPTTTEDRLERIAGDATGFLYAVSRAGVTGAREEASTPAEDLVTRARKYTDLPIAVGFGISTRKQILEVWRYADAAVVGSAIVSEIERSIDTGDPVERVRGFVNELLPAVEDRAVEN